MIFDGILNRTPIPAVRLNPALPPEFERALEKAMEKDRGMRYQSAAELRADLKRIQRALESGRTAPAHVPAQARPSSKRVLLAGGVVLALLITVGGIAWYQKHGSPHTVAVAAKPSVAVLPLHNLSAEPDSSYFSEGMTDEILPSSRRFKPSTWLRILRSLQ